MRTTLVLLALTACGKNTAPVAESAPPVASSAPAKKAGCGAFDCTQVDTIADAIALALESKPLVVAVGEAHAQKAKEGVPSGTKHFTEEVLPLLKGKASDLIVELMMPAKLPDGGACVQVAQAVKEKQTAVTSQQASTNQNEYVTMGNAARSLGIIPDLLRPTCEDLDAIDKAPGAEMVDRSLKTIKRLTAEKVKKQLERNKETPADAEKLVVTYGGALHNDIAPSPERAPWSFGPELSTYTGNRYVELDFYVADYIEDTDNWKKLEWYAHYDKQKLGSKITVFRPREGAFVIILPRSGG